MAGGVGAGRVNAPGYSICSFLSRKLVIDLMSVDHLEILYPFLSQFLFMARLISILVAFSEQLVLDVSSSM